VGSGFSRTLRPDLDNVMNITELLKQGDPTGNEPPLTPDDLQRMRRLVTTTLPEPLPRLWPRPLVVMATLALALASSVVIGRRLPAPHTTPPGKAVIQPLTQAGSVSQLEFTTPGGTRIIWTFEPDFKL